MLETNKWEPSFLNITLESRMLKDKHSNYFNSSAEFLPYCTAARASTHHISFSEWISLLHNPSQAEVEYLELPIFGEAHIA